MTLPRPHTLWLLNIDTVREQLSLWMIVSIALLTLATLMIVGTAVFLRIRNARKAGLWQALEKKWEPHLMAVLTGSMPVYDLVNLVRRGEELYFVDFLQRYASRLTGTEQETVQRVARPFMGLIAQHLVKGDAERRARAVQTVAVLGMEERMGMALEALNDPVPLVAMLAARTLSQTGDPAYAEPILQHLERFGTWSPKFLASMLVALGPGALDHFRKAFADERRPVMVRVVTAEALTALNDFSAADLAAHILVHSSDRELRAACLRILSRVGRPEHAELVRPLLSAPDEVIRGHAVRALSNLGSPQDMLAIEAALADDSPWVALSAAKGLSTGHGTQVLERIAASEHPRADLARQVLGIRQEDDG